MRTRMRKTKIVCTIGPASRSRGMIRKMISAGMNVARLNFSYGTRSEHQKTIRSIRSVSDLMSSPIAILQDLQGLKIRVGPIRGGSVLLKKGATLSLGTGTGPGDARSIHIPYPRLINNLKPGDNILMDDGLIHARVIEKDRGGLKIKVIEGGLLRERKGVNLPGVLISARPFTKDDRDDLLFGIQNKVDYIALSFVHSKKEIMAVKRILREKNSEIPLIAKIETRQAVGNIDDIITVSDGLMIARGDLGVEMPPEEIPLIQKRIIEKCNRALKPVITATQMLESMTEHTRPTRAEAADVANAVIDGTDALMLSTETAIGKHPQISIRMMDRISRFTEAHNQKSYSTVKSPGSFVHAIAESACSSAADIGAKVIVAFSRSGFTALLVSKFRPLPPVIGLAGNADVRRRMNLYRGIIPLVMRFPVSTDDMISASERLLIQKRIVRKGDPVVIIATSPFTLGGKTNIMKLHRVGADQP